MAIELKLVAIKLKLVAKLLTDPVASASRVTEVRWQLILSMNQVRVSPLLRAGFRKVGVSPLLRAGFRIILCLKPLYFLRNLRNLRIIL